MAKKRLHPLHRYRLKAKLTQEELGNVLDVSRGMIAHIENNRRGVSPRTAKKWETLIPVSKEVLCPEVFGRSR